MKFRRDVLCGTAGAGLAMLGGCSGAGEDGAPESDAGDDGSDADPDGTEDGTNVSESDFGMDGEYPSYAKWLPSETSRPDFVHTSIDRVEASSVLRRNPFANPSDGESLYPAFDATAPTIPAVQVWLLRLHHAVASGPFPFLKERLAYASDREIVFDDRGTVADPIVETEAMTSSGNVFVVSGDVDIAAVEAAVDALEREMPERSWEFERRDRDGDVIFEAVDSPDGFDGVALVARERHLAVGTNLEESVDRLASLPNAPDEAGLAIAEDLTWLLERCGDGAVIYGAGLEPDGTDTDVGEFGMGVPEDDLESLWDLYDGGNYHVMHVDADGDGHVTRSGVAYDSTDAVPSEAEIADVLATGAADHTIVTDDTRFVVEAVWEDQR